MHLNIQRTWDKPYLIVALWLVVLLMLWLMVHRVVARVHHRRRRWRLAPLSGVSSVLCWTLLHTCNDKEG